MCRRSSHSRWRNRTIAAMTLSLIARGLLAGRRDLRVDRLQAALVIPLEQPVPPARPAVPSTVGISCGRPDLSWALPLARAWAP
jgi:hypothetical protein